MTPVNITTKKKAGMEINTLERKDYLYPSHNKHTFWFRADDDVMKAVIDGAKNNQRNKTWEINYALRKFYNL